MLSLEYKRSDAGEEDVEVRFYPYDKRYVSVNVNGNEFFLVSSREVEQLQEVLEKSF